MSTSKTNRLRLLWALALACGALAMLPVLSAQAAGPAQYCTGVFLYAGGTQNSSNTCVHGGGHQLTTTQGKSQGTAATCVGGFDQTYGNWAYYYGGPACGGAGGSWVYHDSYGDPEYPALHNHSTFQSRFDGLFYYN